MKLFSSAFKQDVRFHVEDIIEIVGVFIGMQDAELTCNAGREEPNWRNPGPCFTLIRVLLSKVFDGVQELELPRGPAEFINSCIKI